MRRSVTPDQLGVEIQRLEKLIGKVHLNLQAQLVGHAIDDLVDFSPVLTGAYKASHIVMQGGNSESPVYQGPDRQPDDLDVPEQPLDRFMGASGHDAREAVQKDAEPYQNLEVRNGRFYSDKVEVRHDVYDNAYQTTLDQAEILAQLRIVLE